MSTSAIEAHHLRKVFSTLERKPGFVGGVRSFFAPERSQTVAVEDVSFTIAPGELVAMLGPNGAGKSTTIKMLTGIVTPTSGEVLVDGHVPHEHRTANAYRIGAVFGQRTQLWWELPARESYQMLGHIYGIPPATLRQRLAELDALLEFMPFAHRRPRQMSLGQRVRSDLAAALLHDPPILFLDEPTIGMDAVAKELVRTFLRHQVEQRGKTVVLTTHDMTEVSRLAERVMLVNHGRIVYDGGLAALHQVYGSGWRVRVTLAEGITPPSRGLVGPDGGALLFAGRDGAEQRDLIRVLFETGGVEALEVLQDDLEDLMATVYRAHPAAVEK